MDAHAQTTARLGNLTAKQKIVGATAGFAFFYLSSLMCCSGSTWFIAADYGAQSERERIARDKEAAVKEAKEAIAKIFSVPAAKKKDAVSEWLTPDKVAIIDTVHVELLEGTIGKIRLKERFGGGGSSLTPGSYFQVKIRITNKAENVILQYTPWADPTARPRLVDEHGNEYKHSVHRSNDMVGGVDFAKRRVDPGKSVDDVLAFDMPLETSNEFRLELPGRAINKGDAIIAYKIPRSFFNSK